MSALRRLPRIEGPASFGLRGSPETSHPGRPPVSALRARLNEDAIVRRSGKKTRHEDALHVRTLFTFVGGLPETTTAGQARRFQAYQTAAGVGAKSINSSVSACDLRRVISNV
jgi:hypothetical protein